MFLKFVRKNQIFQTKIIYFHCLKMFFLILAQKKNRLLNPTLLYFMLAELNSVFRKPIRLLSLARIYIYRKTVLI